MPKKRTHNQFIAELHSINPCIDVVGTYINSATKIECKCQLCGTYWNASPSDLLEGHGCPTCGRKSSTNKRRKSHDDFVRELASINPDIIVEGQYYNSKANIACRCRTCGYVWSPVPNSLLSGKGCPNCAGRPKKDTSYFVEELSKKHPDIQVLGEYKNNRKGIRVKCKVCGHIWTPTPTSLLSGRGCPKCSIAKLALSKAKNHEQFLKDLYKVNPNIIALEEYTTSKTPIKCKCSICGTIWNPIPNTLLSGEGCPICGKKKSIESRTKSLDVVVGEIKKISPNIEIVGEYSGTHRKVRCRCMECGYEWNPTPHSLLQGAGCPNCAGVAPKTTEQFIAELSRINPDIEVIGQYINSHVRIDVRCRRCGNEWKASAPNLLYNHGCPNCAHTSTSFMEQVLLIGFRKALGEDKVFSRDRKTIGMELDIYIPSLMLAVEPGSWFYHEKLIDRDLKKRNLAGKRKIRLITVYDSFPEERPPFEKDCFVFPSDLRQENGHNSLRWLIGHILQISNMSYTFSDKEWDDIIALAYSKSRRQTTEEFIKKLEKTAKEIEVLGEYESSKRKIPCRCRKCGHEWMITPGDLLQGYGCPNCAGNQKKTDVQFKEEVHRKHPSINILGEYTNINTPIECECSKCGYTWKPFPSTLLRGNGCPKCLGRPLKDTAYFVKELARVNPNIEVLGDYINNHTPIKVRCKICGTEWETSPKSLLRGRSHKNASKLHSLK